MAREIEINTNTLNRDIQAMESRLKSLNDTINRMYDAVLVLDSTWKGVSNEAFVKQFNLDRQAMSELLEVLNKLKQHMEYARQEYDSCEQQVGNIVASIKI